MTLKHEVIIIIKTESTLIKACCGRLVVESHLQLLKPTDFNEVKT